MNKLKLLKVWGAIGLSILTFVVSVLIAHPSTATATNAKYQRLIAMGVIDAVVTPHELGLDYLQQEAIELSASDELIDSIKYAEAGMAQMTEDIALAFPLGTNDPIAINVLPNDTGTPEEAYDTLAIGYLGNDGESHPFEPPAVEGMFDTEANNGGNLAMTPEAQEILVADASGGFFQSRRIPVFDLIVYLPQTRQRFIVPNVNANAVCRDALNAFFNRTFIEL